MNQDTVSPCHIAVSSSEAGRERGTPGLLRAFRTSGARAPGPGRAIATANTSLRPQPESFHFNRFNGTNTTVHYLNWHIEFDTRNTLNSEH